MLLQRLTPAQRLAKLQRTVFVGNLPVSSTSKQLKKLFGAYGKVESVRLRSVPVKLDVKMTRKLAIATGVWRG